MTLLRDYGTCPMCGVGLFPLDEELALLPGSLTPRQQEHLVHLASCMPFERAAQMMEAVTGCASDQRGLCRDGWGRLAAKFYRDAVRILDFPHAAEHLSALTQALEQAGVSLPPYALCKK